MAVLLGAVVFCIAVLPSARASRRTRRIVWGSWIVLTLSTIVGLLLYGPYVSGLGFGDAFKWSVIEATLDQRLGEVWAVRLGLLLIGAGVLLRAVPARRAREPRATCRPRG